MKRHAIPLLVLSSLLLALAACGQVVSSGPQTVMITERDFSIHSSQTTFTAGVLYHFEVTNDGEHNHDFLIMHPMDTGLMVMDDVVAHAQASILNIAPGQSKTLDVTFDHTAPSGMLELSDHFGGQYQAGMHEGIVVNDPLGGSYTPYPNNGIPDSANTSAIPTTSSHCDPPVTVTIGSSGAYEEQSVSINQGDTLTIVNTTQQEFTLSTQPDAGIRFTTVDPGETEHVPFLKAGNFLVSSQEHPEDTLMVHVASTAGVTCGFIPAATVSFDVRYSGSDEEGQYFITPTSVTIKTDQSIILSNISDASALTFTSQPDANLGNPKLDTNEHQFLLFEDSGTYTISCVQFPKVQFTVVVQ
ncbi:MAG TPA: hypothetical protein VEI53_10325 [Ktedonobacteraceae bacterium]|nr:hypothetical protein [Ktedonobacteraceae bacterium]